MTTQSVCTRGPVPIMVRGVPLLWRRISETIRTWRSRIESRCELAMMSDSALKDIGYPAAAEAEKSKPFWRA